MDQETRLKRSHIMLMKNVAATWYSGISMMGVSEVLDKSFSAYTDGVNKRYSRPFMPDIKDDAKLRGLIMHENLHVALKHMKSCAYCFQTTDFGLATLVVFHQQEPLVEVVGPFVQEFLQPVGG